MCDIFILYQPISESLFGGKNVENSSNALWLLLGSGKLVSGYQYPNVSLAKESI